MNTGQTQANTGNPADKRYFPRWKVSNRVLFQLENHTEIMQGKTKDISCAGACISIDKPINKQKIKLTLFLSSDTSVIVEGNVLWNNMNGGDSAQIGVLFSELNPQAQDLILQYAFNANHEKVVNHWFDGWNDSPKKD